ncbi:hypothetical protein F4779DRAFT_574358 [Xylariaceae sp. FL0662B]|nr:hypothetical protein F4779DRAFT_574358 [Xylariaceae sp. FL0662B]
MTDFKGEPLREFWPCPNRTPLDLENPVRQLAAFYAECFKRQFRNIGNLYPTASIPNVQLEPVPIRKIATIDYLWKYRPIYQADRGPFCTSRQWLLSRLSLLSGDCLMIYGDLNRNFITIAGAHRF